MIAFIGMTKAPKPKRSARKKPTITVTFHPFKNEQQRRRSYELWARSFLFGKKKKGGEYE
jgi:hypothetical protein